jgi:flagellar biosynthesis repressor protein FlbT
MALVIDLKPNERIIIGEAVITNDKHRTRLHIEVEVAILREKDILREEEANTPCQKVYLAVQLMYLSKTPQKLHSIYFTLIKDIVQAAPSTIDYFLKINDAIMSGSYYKALKASQDLIDYEAKLLGHVKENVQQTAP